VLAPDLDHLVERVTERVRGAIQVRHGKGGRS